MISNEQNNMGKLEATVSDSPNKKNTNNNNTTTTTNNNNNNNNSDSPAWT